MDPLRTFHGTGEAIGSAHIDVDFEKLVISRLGPHRQHLTWTPEQTALKMARKGFERLKCEYGSDASIVPTYSVAVPGLAASFHDAHANILNSKMILTELYLLGKILEMELILLNRDEMRRLFDAQVKQMIGLIDRQLERILDKFPGEQIVSGAYRLFQIMVN